MAVMGWLLVMVAGTAAIVGGAELFTDHLAAASRRLGISAFALALLLAGAEPEELATVIAASARGVDGVAFGDVIGANAAIITVALGVGAVVAPLPFGAGPRRYALAGLAAAMVAGIVIWDGAVSRAEGGVLVTGYVVFVAAIWRLERRPPALGETGELAGNGPSESRVGPDLVLVVVGLAMLTAGSLALVEAVRHISGAETTQTRLGLLVVGFATAFELVVLASSASRRGVAEAAVGGVVGSFAYNLTMSLGAGAVVAPIAVADASTLHPPFVVMAALLVLVLVVSGSHGSLGRDRGLVLLTAYLAFVAAALVG
jgi:cation:H+ antiporter